MSLVLHYCLSTNIGRPITTVRNSWWSPNLWSNPALKQEGYMRPWISHSSDSTSSQPNGCPQAHTMTRLVDICSFYQPGIYPLTMKWIFTKNAACSQSRAKLVLITVLEKPVSEEDWNITLSNLLENPHLMAPKLLIVLSTCPTHSSFPKSCPTSPEFHLTFLAYSYKNAAITFPVGETCFPLPSKNTFNLANNSP